jgi:hypothetical protein
VYLPNSGPGWSQSHYYQFLKNTQSRQTFKGRVLEYDKVNTTVNVRTGIFPNVNSSIAKDLTVLRTTGCGTALGSLEFLIFDKKTGNPVNNTGPIRKNEIFPPDSITGHYIVIAVLSPKITEDDVIEELDMTMDLSIGSAKEDSCWNMVTKCCHENKRDDVKLKTKDYNLLSYYNLIKNQYKIKSKNYKLKSH